MAKKESNKKIKCLGSCGRELTLSPSNFFKSHNPEYKVIDGYAPYCKGCLRERIFDDRGIVDIDKLKDTLRILDKPFIRKAFDDVMAKGKFTLGDYNSLLNFSENKSKTFKDSDNDENVKSNKSNHKNDDIEDDGIEIEMLRDKWGFDLPKQQLVWMERSYEKWARDYSINNEKDEIIVQQIIFENWYMYNERQNGKDVSDRIKTINTLFKAGDFKKREETENTVESIALYIAEWEKGKPITRENPSPEFKDPDNFIKLGKVLAGAIARTIGKNNSFTDEFEEYYKKHTMDLTNLENPTKEEEVINND